MDNEGKRYVEYQSGKEKTQQGGLQNRKVLFKAVRYYASSVSNYFQPAEKQTQTSQDVVVSIVDLLSV